MLPDDKVKCPYTGFAKTCRSIVSKSGCPKWINVIGKHPQTGQDINQWNCADAWIPLLLIANTHAQHQTAAAVEDFRNEVVGNRPHSDMPALEPARTIDHGRRIS